MKLRFTILTTVVAALILMLPFQGTSKAKGTHELGVIAGVANYMGDLEESRLNFAEYNPVAGFMHRYYFNSNLNMRSGLSFGHVSGSDEHYEERQERRGFNFRSPILELSLLFEWNILPFDGKTTNDNFSPYLFGGLALFYFSPQGEGVQLSDRHGFAINRSQYSIPMGGGLKINIVENFNLGLEVGARKTFTDYLDGVSSEHGNDETNDWYGISGLTLTFTLP